MEAKDLLDMGQINIAEYHTYLLFETNDEGREYLRRMWEAICMEDPLAIDSEAPYAWQDGRRSVVRDLKKSVAEVKLKLNICEEYKNG